MALRGGLLRPAQPGGNDAACPAGGGGFFKRKLRDCHKLFWEGVWKTMRNLEEILRLMEIKRQLLRGIEDATQEMLAGRNRRRLPRRRSRTLPPWRRSPGWCS